MCVKKFWGYTCGHCSPPSLVKCPTTSQNENFPPCSMMAEQPVFANQFCHGCMRVSWNMQVIADENAHRERHERGECSCEIIFDRAERERREKERELREERRENGEREVRALREGGEELEARELRREGERNGSGSGRDGNARVGTKGRGRGRDAVTDKIDDKNNSEGRDGRMEESRENTGMMRGSNGDFIVGAASSEYPDPRPTDPASLHRYFHVANQMGNIGHSYMNPMTDVTNGIPISNPPLMTSSSPIHGNMMIIPPSPRMNSMGEYPTNHPIHSNQRIDNHPLHPFGMMHTPPPPPAPAGPPSYQSPPMAPSNYSDGNNSSVCRGNQYSWSPNTEPNAPTDNRDHRSYNHTGQTRVQYPTVPEFAEPIPYPQHQNIDLNAQRNAYNYVGYYMDRPNAVTNGSPQTRAQGPGPVSMTDHQTTGTFIRAPTFSPLPGGAAGAGMVWHASHNDLPPLPPQIPYLGDSVLVPPVVPAAPRYFNETPPASRRHVRNGNAQRNAVQRPRTSQSIGQIQVDAATTTEGPARTDFHGQATTQGQARMASEITPAATNISLLRTPRVISSVPRPNSTM
ncbi:hypothetical protein OCU04_012175 [Sclerotinia nivalis]|uniref:Uncharacterized protein n=1 Tax=Sclerotinia nivalis TaxID=352851 RepID=A0A9X0AAE5_9HELO|nr:hypothetical protein OCU04_012175 [Sclerotinia nivalis]